MPEPHLATEFLLILLKPLIYLLDFSRLESNSQAIKNISAGNRSGKSQLVEVPCILVEGPWNRSVTLNPPPLVRLPVSFVAKNREVRLGAPVRVYFVGVVMPV